MLGDVDVELPGVLIQNCDIHHCSDGIRLASRVEMAHSWVHDLRRGGGLHPDCAQAIQGAGGLIHQCLLDSTDDDPDEGA